MSSPDQTKTSTRAAAGAGIVFVAQILGYAFYFFAQRIIVSGMSKEAFGSLAYIQLLCSIVLIVLVDAGMNNVAVREMIRRPEHRQSIIASVFWLRVIGTLISCIVAAGIFVVTSSESVPLVTVAVLMIALSSRSAMIRGAVELPFREQLQFTVLSLTFVADLLIYVLLLLVYQGSLTPMTIFMLQLVSSLPGFMYIAWRVKLRSLIFPIPSRAEFKHLIREVRPLTAQLLSQNIHAAIDLFVLRYYAPLREIGVLGAVGNMGSIIITAYTALSMALYPMVSEALHSTRGNATYRIERTLSFISFVSVLLATVLSVLSPFIANIFTKDVYADNVFEFQMQFWCAVVINLAQTGLIINSAQNQHKAMFLSGIFLLVGSFTADFILIPNFYCAGLLGAKMWSNGLSAIVSLWYIGHTIGFDLVRRFSLRFVGLCVVASPFSFFALHYLPMSVATGIGIVLVCVVAWLLGLVTTDEVDVMKRLVKKFRDYLPLTSNAQV